MTEPKRCATCGRTYATETDFLAGTSRWRICNQENLWFNCSCGSTLMLRKGKYDWYAPGRLLSEEARGVFNRLSTLKQMPHLPSSVMELQALLATPEVSPKLAAQALRKEPVIAAHVLKTAEGLRNARNPANPPIRSLEHAIVYIGCRTLSDLIVASALKAFPLPPSDFDSDAFWNEAYVRGAVAEELTKRLGLAQNLDEVYLAASLCDVGKLAMAFCFPPLATKIAHDVKDARQLSTWRQAEIAYQFPEHTLLGEIAASLWGLPVFVIDAARLHHKVPHGKTGTPLAISELAAVSVQLTHWALLQPHRIENDVLSAFTQRVGMSQTELETLALELTDLRKAVLTAVAA